jgi:hypothetical protein
LYSSSSSSRGISIPNNACINDKSTTDENDDADADANICDVGMDNATAAVVDKLYSSSTKLKDYNNKGRV